MLAVQEKKLEQETSGKAVSSYSRYNLQYLDVTQAPGARCAQVLTCVNTHTHTSAMQTLRQEADRQAENSLSTLSPCSHALDVCLKPTHTEPFLFILLVLKNVTKSPGMWEKASGLLKLLWVGLIF